MHHRHKELGATIMWTGEWRRPYAYGDPEAEARAVHASVGIIDVSTLGKILDLGQRRSQLSWSASTPTASET